MIFDFNYESEAKARGWVPLSEFKGDPEKHIGAVEYLASMFLIIEHARAANRGTTPSKHLEKMA